MLTRQRIAVVYRPFDCLFVCRAESATKAKLEKVAEIKRLNAQLVATKK